MRSIRRSEQFEPMVQKLSMTEHPATRKSLFPTIRDLMCFAAALGFESDRRESLTSKTHEVDSRIWNNSQQAVDFVYLVGLASMKDGDVLLEENEEQLVQTFEEYAQGGLEVLSEWLRDLQGDLNGDEAILAALNKGGFLNQQPDAEMGLGDLTF